MKQFLFITAIVLAVCAAVCLVGAIVISTHGSQKTNMVFGIGVAFAAASAIVGTARSMFYDNDDTWTQDLV